MRLLALLVQIPGPRDCLLTGGCPSDVPRPPGPASGWMWVAIGLVVIGLVGFAREWRRPREVPAPKSSFGA
ncbi:MAG: hypothetical protein ABI647_16385 [Gemmatimonadota bacterium]